MMADTKTGSERLEQANDKRKRSKDILTGKNVPLNHGCCNITKTKNSSSMEKQKDSNQSE